MTTEPHDDLQQQIDDAAEEAGWDAFWDEVLREEAEASGRAPTETIRGVTVKVPQDLPLKFEAKARQLRSSNDEEAFASLLADLFGADVLDAWRENGMGAREFRTVLAWGMSHGRGKPITFREAYELVQAEDAADDDEGDAGKARRSTRKNAKSDGSGS